MSEPAVKEDADFFMLWTKTGHLPRYRHATFDLAATEAERLARENPGKKFIVLKAVAKYHVEPKLAAPPTQESQA